MELVPVIYIVLIIVAVLAVIAISVSYISFKMKKKEELIEEPASKFVKPEIKIKNRIEKSVIEITRPLHAERSEKNNNKPHKENIPYKPKQQSSSELQQPHQNEKANKQSNRIEVVKKIKNDKRDVEIDKPVTHPTYKKNDVNFKTLDDNVIDKYADDTNNEMFTLDIKKKDNKKN
jgi:hypothetical protein